MGAKSAEMTGITKEEDAEADEEIWRYIFGFVETGVVRCAIELGIADALEANEGQPMTLSQLSATINCPPSPLYRIMRFLVHRRVFKEETTGYALTPISRRFITRGERSMAALLLLESSPVILAPWQALAACVRTEDRLTPFKATHGQDHWEYTARHPSYSKLFDDGMACHARVAVAAIKEGCDKLFEGISTVVDVGGGNGTTVGLLVKAFPWLRAINFDLPHVVSTAPPCDRVEHIGGDMFKSVPKTDAVFLMWVLHDWDDEACIHILRNCKEAIAGDDGKVIIVEAVIKEEKEYKYKGVGLMLDMLMMIDTNNGKERTQEEWSHILDKAGFSCYTFTPIPAIQSIIQAYP
ncbi:hypothetical protein NE237_017181 [Protea cynaroides]|uniref:Uncharacterized protein n=1 Tax=Protea cynaroides TaxID=273540 RepID=A0A9Q0K7I9_9MAGN|nr:hypothetical protein NE237_017181 [Protea cynaroides]